MLAAITLVANQMILSTFPAWHKFSLINFPRKRYLHGFLFYCNNKINATMPYDKILSFLYDIASIGPIHQNWLSFFLQTQNKADILAIAFRRNIALVLLVCINVLRIDDNRCKQTEIN